MLSRDSYLIQPKTLSMSFCSVVCTNYVKLSSYSFDSDAFFVGKNQHGPAWFWQSCSLCYCNVSFYISVCLYVSVCIWCAWTYFCTVIYRKLLKLNDFWRELAVNHNGASIINVFANHACKSSFYQCVTTCVLNNDTGYQPVLVCFHISPSA